MHGRTREQFYSGNADYEIIAKVKSSVKIPVTGNGDIFLRRTLKECLTRPAVIMWLLPAVL